MTSSNTLLFFFTGYILLLSLQWVRAEGRGRVGGGWLPADTEEILNHRASIERTETDGVS